MTSSTIASDAPFSIVLNGKAGHHDVDGTRREIERTLAEAGRRFSLHLVEDPADLPSIARRAVSEARARGGVVVVAGGDGSINAVAQATLGSECALAVLPQGTFNYFSRTHGIPSETAEALRLMLAARAHPVQVGLVNERLFLVNASLGLYPQLLEDREAYKAQFGRSRPVALASAFKTLLREHRQLRLCIEGPTGRQVLRTPTLFVGNNQLQLEQIGIDEAARLEHGRLAGIVLRPVGTWALLWLALRGAFGQLGAAENVQSFAFRHITVSPALPYGPRRVKVATDGEVSWLNFPLEFRVSSEPLWLLRPDPAPQALRPTLP